jgi:hypothetical protein
LKIIHCGLVLAALLGTTPGAPAFSEPAGPASEQKWCAIVPPVPTEDANETAQALIAQINAPGDALGQAILSKLTTMGCKAGDVVSFQTFDEPYTMVGRFCDLDHEVYQEKDVVVCRWTGKMRSASAATFLPSK